MSNAWAFMGSHFPTLPALLPSGTATGPGSLYPIAWPLTGAGETIAKVEGAWKEVQIAGTGSVGITGPTFGGVTISNDFDISASQEIGGADWDVLVSGAPVVGGRPWFVQADKGWDIATAAYASEFIGDITTVDVSLIANIADLFIQADGRYTKQLVVTAVAGGSLVTGGGTGEGYRSDWSFDPSYTGSFPWSLFGQTVNARKGPHVGSGVPLEVTFTLSTLSMSVLQRFPSPGPLG